MYDTWEIITPIYLFSFMFKIFHLYEASVSEPYNSTNILIIIINDSYSDIIFDSKNNYIRVLIQIKYFIGLQLH